MGREVKGNQGRAGPLRPLRQEVLKEVKLWDEKGHGDQRRSLPPLIPSLPFSLTPQPCPLSIPLCLSPPSACPTPSLSIPMHPHSPLPSSPL